MAKVGESTWATAKRLNKKYGFGLFKEVENELVLALAVTKENEKDVRFSLQEWLKNQADRELVDRIHVLGFEKDLSRLHPLLRDRVEWDLLYSQVVCNIPSLFSYVPALSIDLPMKSMVRSEVTTALNILKRATTRKSGVNKLSICGPIVDEYIDVLVKTLSNLPTVRELFLHLNGSAPTILPFVLTLSHTKGLYILNANSLSPDVNKEKLNVFKPMSTAMTTLSLCHVHFRKTELLDFIDNLNPNLQQLSLLDIRVIDIERNDWLDRWDLDCVKALYEKLNTLPLKKLELRIRLDDRLSSVLYENLTFCHMEILKLNLQPFSFIAFGLLLNQLASLKENCRLDSLLLYDVDVYQLTYENAREHEKNFCVNAFRMLLRHTKVRKVWFKSGAITESLFKRLLICVKESAHIEVCSFSRIIKGDPSSGIDLHRDILPVIRTKNKIYHLGVAVDEFPDIERALCYANNTHVRMSCALIQPFCSFKQKNSKLSVLPVEVIRTLIKEYILPDATYWLEPVPEPDPEPIFLDRFAFMPRGAWREAILPLLREVPGQPGRVRPRTPSPPPSALPRVVDTNQRVAIPPDFFN